MIPNFPQPFPDELLYSLIARYYWLIPCHPAGSMVRRLFGGKGVFATMDPPTRLGAFCSIIGDVPGLDIQSLIRNHTLLPLYAPFMPPHRLALVEEGLINAQGNAVRMRAKIVRKVSHASRQFRFCPCCAADERAQTGEAYWHRLHQVPGVYVCPVHKVFLEASPDLGRFRRTRREFVPAEDAIPESESRPIDNGNIEHQALLRIAKSASWLLNNFCAGNEPVSLQERYRGHAMKLGYATGGEMILWKILLPDFQKRFSETLLEKLDCFLSTGVSYNWIMKMFKACAVQPPWRHLVLMDFFGLTPEVFLKTEFGQTIFGPGPWRCENSVCPQLGEPTIKEIHYEQSHKRRRPLGVFACPVCGQVKCRVPVEGKGIVWTRNFGTLWEAKLANLWKDPKVTVSGIAIQLGASPHTVMCHAAKAGLPFPREGENYISGRKGPPKAGRTTKPIQADLMKRRAEWLALRATFPAKSITELIHQAPSCHQFLRRYDREWLGAHCPIWRRPQRQADWNGRDQKLSQRISEAKAKLMHQHQSPKRISLAALERQLGVPTFIQSHLSKLPLTRALLPSVVESHMDFALRKIADAARQLRNENHQITKRILIMRSHLGSATRSNPVIAGAILAELASVTLRENMTDQEEVDCYEGPRAAARNREAREFVAALLPPHDGELSTAVP